MQALGAPQAAPPEGVGAPDAGLGERSEPIAIVGMSAIYPGARTLDAFRESVLGVSSSGEGAPVPRLDGSAARIDGYKGDLGRYGIPPIQGPSLATLQLMTLEAVDRCLDDAGYGKRSFDRDTTDVVCGFCFGFDRTFANALRVDAGRFVTDFVDELGAVRQDLVGAKADKVVDDLHRAFERRFGGSPHDRPGEMASTIAARVTMAFKLHGRAAAIESADATSFLAVQQAVFSLRTGACNAAIVAAGQRIESGLMVAAMQAKKLLTEGPMRPFARQGTGFVPSEGVGALLLKRLSDALRDGDRVYALITGVGATHTPQPGSFRYSSSRDDRREAVEAACRDAGVSPRSLGYIECFGSGHPEETAIELAALAEALGGSDAPPASVVLGCVKELLGHTFANAGLAAIMKTALAIHGRRLLPQRLLGEGDALPLDGTPFAILREGCAWPKRHDGQPRRAGVNGSGLTGTNCHIVLEEFDSQSLTRHRPEVRVRATASSAAPGNTTHVAVVGFGGCFAEAPGADAYWDNIWRKRDTLKPLSDSQFSRRTYFDPIHPSLFKSYTDIGSRIDESPLSPQEYRIPPKRLLYMDPAQRMALRVATEAFTSFGFPDRPLPTKKSAVVIASNLSLGSERVANNGLEYAEYERVLDELPLFRELDDGERARVLSALRGLRQGRHLPIAHFTLDGYLASGISAVLSNQFGLGAVPMAVEAACASSLAALDIAVRGLAAHHYDFVVAGGVELPANPLDLVLASALRLLSTTKIAPFDAKADGFSVGDGVGMFLLKRLEDAKAAGDPIFAVIRAVGASTDAKSLIAPDVAGQALAIRRAFAQVEFGPEAVQYVEAHGTGTALGDQVEVASLAAVYGNGKRSAPLAIGSVKSMIGHSFAAAGSAGMLRTIMAMNAKTLPPSINVNTLNPKLPLHAIPAYVNTELGPWQAPRGAPRRAAVSAFGTGGINFHVLVEEHEEGKAR